MHRTPAFFPFGMPGMAELIDMTIQQAPHPFRQFIRPWSYASPTFFTLTKFVAPLTGVVPLMTIT